MLHSLPSRETFGNKRWVEFMTLILKLPDNKKTTLKAKALAQGVSADHCAQQVLDRDLEDTGDSEPFWKLSHVRWKLYPMRFSRICHQTVPANTINCAAVPKRASTRHTNFSLQIPVPFSANASSRQLVKS